jgi:signal transduction histidine kinase
MTGTTRAASIRVPPRSLLRQVLQIQKPWPASFLLPCLGGAMLAIFIFDLCVPLELAPEMLYAAVVLGSLWLRRPRWTVALAGVSTLLILLADREIVTGVVLVNHGLSILLVWAIAGLVVGIHDFLAEIQAHAATLDQRVQARTAELSQALLRVAIQSEQLRMLAADLTLAEQRERRRLAEQLHEELQQQLAAMRVRVGVLELTGDPQVQASCHEIAKLLGGAIEYTRSLSRSLCPPILALHGLVPALEWLTGWMREQYGLLVTVQVMGDAPPEAAEEIRVLCFQAIREVLFNAAKHAQVSRATVEVAQHAGCLTIAVTDAGVGFDPGQLWTPRGSGFGLLNLQQRLELLGGTLEIASRPGAGTRIRVSVPLQAPLPALDLPASAGGPRGGRDIPPGAHRRVLLVDDHTLVRQALALLLCQEPDLTVVGEAADGQAAVAQARTLQPDVILMDVAMPGMNGLEATRLIRAACPATRVIGLSMFENAEQAQAMRAAGAAEYVTKSGPVDTLLAALRGGTG